VERNPMEDMGIVEEPDGESVVRVAVCQLLPADSPRLAGEDEQHVRMLAGLASSLPPITVHRSTMRVIDGMHRLRAAELRGDETIDVRFFSGSDREAFVLAVRTNVTHGLPLSLSDRTAAASRILTAYPQWSDRAIGSVTGIAASTVAAIRRQTVTDDGPSAGRIGLDGRVRPRDSSQARRLAGDLIAENPAASLREIARGANISLSTARDVRQRLNRGESPVRPSRRAQQDTAQNEKQDDRNQPRPAAAGQPAPHSPDVNGEVLLRGLRSDPSLRFSEVGRALLRLLDLHALDQDRWEQLVDSVPAHCTELVAVLARGCADRWSDFATRLNQRGDAPAKPGQPPSRTAAQHSTAAPRPAEQVFVCSNRTVERPPQGTSVTGPAPDRPSGRPVAPSARTTSAAVGDTPATAAHRNPSAPHRRPVATADTPSPGQVPTTHHSPRSPIAPARTVPAPRSGYSGCAPFPVA
jgi:ParB-like chromosome segregation protein Spo0J